MKYVFLSVVIFSCLVLVACPPLAKDGRDVAAALNGSITAAQEKYQTSCFSNPSQPICKSINRAVEGQNALVTALEAYCGWSVLIPPPDPKAACVPVKGAEAGLKTAIANANLFIVELKGALK